TQDALEEQQQDTGDKKGKGFDPNCHHPIVWCFPIEGELLEKVSSDTSTQAEPPMVIPSSFNFKFTISLPTEEQKSKEVAIPKWVINQYPLEHFQVKIETSLQERHKGKKAKY